MQIDCGIYEQGECRYRSYTICILIRKGCHVFLPDCFHCNQLWSEGVFLSALFATRGVAIGLALQGGLSNLAGGVIILILRPFVIGDYIIENSGKQEGTVVKIDLFYTTLSTVDNRRITVPNGALTNSSIVNVTAKDNRKLEIKVGISYQADLKKAKKILETLLHEDASIMSDQEMQVFVDELAADSVILGLRAWVKTEEYWATKWRLNEKIKLTFDEQGIEIPFPQLDVHIK